MYFPMKTKIEWFMHNHIMTCLCVPLTMTKIYLKIYHIAKDWPQPCILTDAHRPKKKIRLHSHTLLQPNSKGARSITTISIEVVR